MSLTEHLYLNTPFCPSLCHFCNFYKNTSATHEKLFPDADFSADILRELKLQEHRTAQKLKSVYIGGGSPLEMKGRDLEIILTYLHRHHDLSEAEITLESNPFWPGDRSLLKSGLFNRISIGVQSFSEKNLRHLSRTLIPDRDFLEGVGEWVPRVSLDFIYDIPGETNEELLADLQESIRLNPEHLSWYSLEITSDNFKKRFENIPLPEFSEQFHTVLNELRQSGFNQYELSNFSKPGAESVHNRAYWEHQAYLGIGPGAFSSFFDSEKKSWVRTMNEKNLRLYRNQIADGALPVKESENLTDTMRRNEYVFLSLRKTEGLDLDDYRIRFNESFEEVHAPYLSRHPAHFSQKKGRIGLSTLGFVFYNFICSELIRPEPKPIL